MTVRATRLRIHPLPVRIAHWLNAVAVICMIGSGWRIYNASPLFDFSFPAWLTLGDWLGGALAIHFAAMWLLATNFAFYVVYGLATGHLRRRLLPIRPTDVLRDLILALRLRLSHRNHAYNAVQRAMYVGVGLAIALAIASGLAIWKPVQFRVLSFLFGGYEESRVVHFVAMAAILLFLVLHLGLVALVPKTLWPMLRGSVAQPAIAEEQT